MSISSPIAQSEIAPAPSIARRINWIHWAFLATIGIGLVWRGLRYFSQFPIWGDEAMLLLNLLDRDFAGLTQQLRFGQIAPLLFLWEEKLALLALGSAEWSVHLFPWLAGLGAFVLFWQTCRASFTPTVAGLAIGIFAVAYYPIRHACEVKPYAFDLLFAVVYLWMTLALLRNPMQTRWLIALVAVTPLAVFSSYPSVFVAGSVSLVILPMMRHASWTQRSLYGLFNLVLLASFFIHYALIGHQQIDTAEAQRMKEFLRVYWKDAFPPDAVAHWPLWLLKVFTGNMLAYPIGANRGGSTLTFLLVLLGSVSIWRKNQRSLLALCWLPFALNLIAALLYKYPFGDSARITLHLAPFICILAAHGMEQLLDWVRSPEWRTRLHGTFYLILLGCGVTGLARDIALPYKTEHDRDVRQLVRDITAQVGAEESVLLDHGRDEDVLAEFSWYLRTQPIDLRWQPAAIGPDTHAYWLVQCGHQGPIAVSPANGWTVAHTEAHVVPPENRNIPPMHCRWTRFVRK